MTQKLQTVQARFRGFLQRIMILKIETMAKWCLIGLMVATLGAATASNFFQALVYHRMAAAKTDMTALAMALESYRIDCLHYPNDIEDGWPWYPTIQLTTPVPYVSSELFFDPFRSEYAPSFEHPKFFYYRYLNFEANLEHWKSVGPSWIYWRPWVSSDQLNEGYEKYGEWKLLSAGPDGVMNHDLVQYPFFSNDLPYDPTNGTVSEGDIVLSQKTAF